MTNNEQGRISDLLHKLGLDDSLIGDLQRASSSLKQGIPYRVRDDADSESIAEMQKKYDMGTMIIQTTGWQVRQCGCQCHLGLMKTNILTGKRAIYAVMEIPWEARDEPEAFIIQLIDSNVFEPKSFTQLALSTIGRLLDRTAKEMFRLSSQPLNEETAQGLSKTFFLMDSIRERLAMVINYNSTMHNILTAIEDGRITEGDRTLFLNQLKE